MPLLLNSINSTNKLNAKEPYWNRLIEVKFYGKENKNESIKVWIQNLGDISKAEYLSNSGGNEWKPIGENKKYIYLSNLAREYLLTQHKINVASSFRWLSKENKDFKNLQCNECPKEKCLAKSEIECFLKCCKEQVSCKNESIKEDQKAFAAYLSNIYANWNDAYLQPLQAHIYFGDDVEFKDNEEPKPKKLIGTTIYGFTDYQYKEKQQIDNKEYSKLINNSNQTINNNKKYFMNYPLTFKLEENDNQLKKIFKETNKNSDIEKNIQKSETNQNNCGNLQCLISRNYVKAFESLEQPFKDISECNKIT